MIGAHAAPPAGRSVPRPRGEHHRLARRGRHPPCRSRQRHLCRLSRCLPLRLRWCRGSRRLARHRCPWWGRRRAPCSRRRRRLARRLRLHLRSRRGRRSQTRRRSLPLRWGRRRALAEPRRWRLCHHSRPLHLAPQRLNLRRRRRRYLLPAPLSHARVAATSPVPGCRMRGLEVAPSLGGAWRRGTAAIAAAATPSARAADRVGTEVRGALTAAPSAGAGASTAPSLFAPASAPAASTATRRHGEAQTLVQARQAPPPTRSVAES